jgi:hypothetical protein
MTPAQLKVRYDRRNDMRRTLFGFATLLFAASAFAQFMPPARDLNDVARLTAEYQRLTSEAFKETGRYAEGLLLVVAVHGTLRDGPANMAIEDALQKIDGYMRQHEKDDPPVPRDVMRFIKLAKTWIEDVKMGPPVSDTLVLRERIHHEILQPMQHHMLMQADQMQQIMLQYQAMTTSVNARVIRALSAATAASSPPDQP